MRADARRHRALLLLPAILAVAAATTYILLHRRYGLPSWTLDNATETASGDGVIDEMIDKGDFVLHPEHHAYRAAQKISLSWTITKDHRRPDGVDKLVYLINDRFVGPTVEVRQGDEVTIEVHNALPGNETTAIHWHGLHVNNIMDGVPGVTQCDLPAGKTFVYRLQILTAQAGTFWYHAHSETQRADGLYGAFIVHVAADTTSAEPEVTMPDQVLMIGDWYHRSGTEVLEYYTDWKHWKIEPSGDSMLLNGQGYFNCSMAVPARPVNCTIATPPSLRVSATRTRLRLINTGSMAGITVAVTGFITRLLEVDGGGAVNMSAPVSQIGILFPGERVDVMLERDGATPRSETSLTVILDPESQKWPNLALTAEQHFLITGDALSSSHLGHRSPVAPSPSALPKLNLATVAGEDLIGNEMPASVAQTLVLYSTISYLARYENRPKGFFNRTSWSVPHSGLPLLAMSRGDWAEPSPFIPQVSTGAWIDVVLNNLDDKTHPFHLHGHSFYVVSSHKPSRPGAYETYNPHDEATPAPGGPYNLVNPIRKDTVSVPAMGYVVLRVIADNPGLWLLHCHVAWHQAVGMGMALEVSNEGNGLGTNDAVRESCRGLKG